MNIVVELRTPSMDGPHFAYDVDVIDGPASVEGGACSLFIDDVVVGPMSYRGQTRRVARRTSRRTARRHR